MSLQIVSLLILGRTKAAAFCRWLFLGDTRMANGTVKWFNPSKGFGFIQPDNGGSDVFVHISAVEQAGLSGLEDNQKVTYELETGRNGKESATALKLV